MREVKRGPPGVLYLGGPRRPAPPPRVAQRPHRRGPSHRIGSLRVNVGLVLTVAGLASLALWIFRYAEAVASRSPDIAVAASGSPLIAGTALTIAGFAVMAWPARIRQR